jgi:hypothetical protein
MVSANTILCKLTPFMNQQSVVVENQGVKDIIGGILDTHKKYQKEYEKEQRFVFCLNSENKAIQEQRRMDYISKFSKELDEAKDKNHMTDSIHKIFEGYGAKFKNFFDFQFH